MSETTSVIPIHLHSTARTMALSPSKVYRLTLDENHNSQECTDRGDKCFSSVDAKLYYEDECKMGVICTKLEGEPCADYQIKIKDQRVIE